MNLAQLQQEATSLKTASIFRYGDPTTFAVRLLPDEVELPGPSKPAAYLKSLAQKLSVQLPDKGAVAVVGAGNCGLIAEALTAGATSVLAIEPRARFKKATDHICGLLRQIHPEADIRTHLGWPGASADLGPFDMILWSEGLDESADPLSHTRNLLKLLNPTGLLVVEVTHGSVSAFAGRINSFRPTPDCWSKLLGHLKAKNEASTLGRSQHALIYKVGRGLTVGEAPSAPTKTKLPPFPKDAPAKTVTLMPPNPENFGEPTPKPTEALPKKKAPPKPKPAKKKTEPAKKKTEKAKKPKKAEEPAPPPPPPAPAEEPEKPPAE